MYLAISTEEKTRPSDVSVARLGPWCPEPASGDAVEIRSAWEDREALAEADAYCRRIQTPLIAALSEYLGKVHQTDLGPRYWRILAGPWLLYYTHQFLDRWRQVEAALELDPKPQVELLRREDHTVPSDTLDFLHFFHSDRHNRQIYSEILRAKGIEGTEVSVGPYEPSEQDPPGGILRRMKRLVRRVLVASVRGVLERSISLLGPRIVCDSLYPTGRLLWGLIWDMKGDMLPLLHEGPLERKAAASFDQARLGLGGIVVEDADEFQRALISSFPYALPTLFLEGHGAARADCGAVSGKVPGAVFASASLHFNDRFKLYAAEWVRRGAELWGMQHGGQYGTARFSMAESLERDMSDRYHTWGWSSLETDEKLNDLPPAKLSTLRGRIRAGGEDGSLVVLGAAGMKNPHQLFPVPLGWQWEDYFQDREKFIEGLSSGWRERLILRVRAQDYGWDQPTRFRARFSGIRLDDDHTPFYERIKSTALVVSDHPGTAFLECVALGVPVIGFWRPDRWEIRDSAKPAFDALKDVGVVFDDPTSAAEAIKERLGAVQAWWKAPEVKKACEEFARQFVRTDEDWRRAWKETLLS